MGRRACTSCAPPAQLGNAELLCVDADVSGLHDQLRIAAGELAQGEAVGGAEVVLGIVDGGLEVGGAQGGAEHEAAIIENDSCHG